MDAQRRAAAKPMAPAVTRKRDLNAGSARGSEERNPNATAPPRGTKRGRDYEGIDKVSDLFVFSLLLCLRILNICGAEVGRFSHNRKPCTKTRTSRQQCPLELVLVLIK